MINKRCVFQDRAYTRTIDLYNISLFRRLARFSWVIKGSLLLAFRTTLAMCLFHFKSLEMIIPKIFAWSTISILLLLIGVKESTTDVLRVKSIRSSLQFSWFNLGYYFESMKEFHLQMTGCGLRHHTLSFQTVKIINELPHLALCRMINR